MIVYLTLRFLKAEAQCIRIDQSLLGIDYGTLPQLRVSNVKELARYVNQHIGTLPRLNDAPPFGQVNLGAIHRTLDIVGIQKVRGRPKKTKLRAAESP